MSNKYFSRVTSSARGEKFNPLIWPFLISTFSYGIGFALLLPVTDIAGESSLYNSMEKIDPSAPVIWGILSLATILMGLTFLMFNIPPAGRISGLLGFMLWVFASLCYAFTGYWVALFAVSTPNMIFWLWQYFNLNHFHAEDVEDAATMQDFENGGYGK